MGTTATTLYLVEKERKGVRYRLSDDSPPPAAPSPPPPSPPTAPPPPPAAAAHRAAFEQLLFRIFLRLKSQQNENGQKYLLRCCFSQLHLNNWFWKRKTNFFEPKKKIGEKHGR